MSVEELVLNDESVWASLDGRVLMASLDRLLILAILMALATYYFRKGAMTTFPCKICGKIFPTKSGRKIHLQKKHQVPLHISMEGG